MLKVGDGAPAVLELEHNGAKALLPPPPQAAFSAAASAAQQKNVSVGESVKDDAPVLVDLEENGAEIEQEARPNHPPVRDEEAGDFFQDVPLCPQALLPVLTPQFAIRRGQREREPNPRFFT